MRRSARALTWSSAGLFALAALLMIAAWLAVATTSGSRFVLAQVSQLLDDQLVIDEVEGAITGPLTLRGLRFDADGLRVEIEQADLDWFPGILLFSRARVHVKTLELRGLRVALLEGESPTTTKSTTGVPSGIKLPVEIQVDNFKLDGAILARGAAESDDYVEQIVLRHVHATELMWDSGGIDLPDVKAATSYIELTAKAHVRPEGDWPLRLDARYSLDLQAQQLPNTSGTTVLTGSLAQLEIVQQLDTPYTMHLEAIVRDPLITPKWQAEMQVSEFALAAFAEDLPVEYLAATITADGDTSQANLVASLQAASTRVQVSGNVDFAEPQRDSPRVDLQLAWQQLIWPLNATTDDYQFASDTGRAQLSGVLDAYRATVNAQVAVPAYPAGTVDVAVAGSLKGVVIDQLALSVLGGQIHGVAAVEWDNGLTTRFNLSGENLDPAGLEPDWPGRLSFAAEGDAAIDTGGPVSAQRVNLASLMVEGVLRNEPVSVRLNGRFDESGLTLPSLVLQAFGSTLQAQGIIGVTATQPIDFQWQLETRDLGFWASGMTGNVQAEGRFAGTAKDQRIQASLTAADIGFTQLQVERAEVTADLGLGVSPVSLNAKVDGLQVGDNQIGRVEFELSGTLAQHILGLRTINDAGTNQLTLSGSLSDLPAEGAAASIAEWGGAAWQFSFDELDINQGDIAIDLIQPDETGYIGKVDAETVSVDDMCFRLSSKNGPAQSTVAGAQRICAQGTGTFADEFSGKITFNSLSLMMFDPLLPGSMDLTGSFSGEVSLGWNVVTSSPRAKMLIDTSAADLQTKNSQGEVQSLLHFAPGKLTANWTDDALTADIELPLTGMAGLRATATLTAGQSGEFSERAIDANVVARLDDLDWLADFLPSVTQLRGELVSNVRIGGTVAGPNLTGSLSLKNGKAILPDPGLTLQQMDVDITGAGVNGLTLAGSVKSGGGTLVVNGQFNDIGTDMTGRMTVTGQRVLILNTPEAEIFASPAINAELEQSQLALVGEVKIDKADIQLASLPQTAATISSDQVIVVADAPAVENGGAFDVSTQLRLLLNDAVSFSGFGLEAKFGGDLNLLDLPGQPTTATGEIDVVEGRYQAYGQDLTIETGKLLFVGGPIDQPGIDVRAVRQPAPGIKVGVIARGSLRAPEFSVFSEPSMNQSDQLAYLVLGRSLETSSVSESSALSRAALALGIKGGNYLTEQFGSKLRVDKIGIEAPAGEANEQAALVVGKYLSPKLFVSYGIGILDAVSTLKIEYLMSSKWRLTSETSVDQGGLDLTYVLER